MQTQDFDLQIFCSQKVLELQGSGGVLGCNHIAVICAGRMLLVCSATDVAPLGSNTPSSFISRHPSEQGAEQLFGIQALHTRTWTMEDFSKGICRGAAGNIKHG